MIKPKNTLTLYQHGNRKGKSDGDEFEREAKAFQKLHGGDCVGIRHDVTPWQRAKHVHRCIAACATLYDNIECFAYFGHGTPKGFPSLGISQSAPGIRSLESFADAFAAVASPDIIVCLYSCLSGKGIGAADWLASYLRANRGLRGTCVITHTTRGHTTWNPNAEFSGEGPRDSGIPIIPRGDPLWPKWRDRLQGDQTFRLSFPFLTVEEIRFLLEGKTNV